MGVKAVNMAAPSLDFNTALTAATSPPSCNKVWMQQQLVKQEQL